MSPRALVVDTDGGIDDAVALWWALTEPRVELAAVVVTGGNVPRDVAATNVLRILHAAGRPDVPVALGVDRAAAGGSAHGVDGLGGFGGRWSTGGLRVSEEPAAALIGRVTAERAGELDVLAIGPLSTLAAAVALDPGVPGRVRALTVMGGPGPGETNFAADPEAAAAVLAAPWPGPPRQVGLDVTLRVLLHDEDLDRAAAGGTAAARFLADPLRAYAAANVARGRVPPGRCPVHDLVAALAAVDQCPVTEERLRLAFRRLIWQELPEH